MPCPHCGADHEHDERFMWTDLPGRLCVVVLHESERPGWPSLEIEAHDALASRSARRGRTSSACSGRRPTSGSRSGSRSCARRSSAASTSLDDRVVEAIKEDLPYGCLLEDARPGTA